MAGPDSPLAEAGQRACQLAAQLVLLEALARQNGAAREHHPLSIDQAGIEG